MSNHICLCEMKNLQVQSIFVGADGQWRLKHERNSHLPSAFGERTFFFHVQTLAQKVLIRTADLLPETNRIFVAFFFVCLNHEKKNTSEPAMM